MAFLADATGAPCALCGRAICGHEALMSHAAGRQDAPLCLSCLSEDAGRPSQTLRDELAGYILRKDCLSRAWAAASATEGQRGAAPPVCLWPASSPAPTADAVPDAPQAALSDVAPPSADRWDAGDMGCGELVLELRLRLAALAPGDVLHLSARDPGAPQDLPAWCRLTGAELVAARPPEYFIRRRN